MNISLNVFCQTVLKLAGAWLFAHGKTTDTAWQPVAGVVMVIVGFLWHLAHSHLIANPPAPQTIKTSLFALGWLCLIGGVATLGTGCAGASGLSGVTTGIGTNSVFYRTYNHGGTNQFKFTLVLPVNPSAAVQSLLQSAVPAL